MAVSRYPHLEWHESAVGRWEREIDETERFYTCLAKSFERSERMFFAITGFVSISIDIPEGSSPLQIGRSLEEALRTAWLRLRYSHPTIASYVGYDVLREKWIKTYNAFHPDTVNEQAEQWLQATFVPVASGMSGMEWCNSDPLAPKFPTLFVLDPMDIDEDGRRRLRRDLIIRSPHDIMDGIGTLHLLNKLISYVAQAFERPNTWNPPSPGTECLNLSPPLRIAASIPPILTLDQQDSLQRNISHNEQLRRSAEILIIPFKRGSIVPGKHQRIAHELSTSETARVLEACKHHGATVTHVYHAAIAITLKDMQVRGAESRQALYINYALVNERPRCIDDYGTTKHAAAVYHSVTSEALALDLTIPATAENNESDQEQCQEELQKLCKQVRDFYHRFRDSPDNLALAPSFSSIATPHLINPTSIPPIPPPNESPSVSISSMGVIDKIVAPRHGPFKVDNPWVTGEELGTGLGMFLGTWEGRLQLSIAYNDAWHDKEEADGFLKHCHEVVWKGLGLNDQ